MGTNRRARVNNKPLINEHDLTKNMLNFIREGATSKPMMTEMEEAIMRDILGNGLLTEGFSDTLEKLKGYAKKGLITAAMLTSLMNNPSFSAEQKEEINNIAQTEMSSQGEEKEKEGSVVLDGPEIKDEMNKLEDFVGSRIKAYDELVIYPYDHNVTWGGEFLNGIRFEFNLTGDMKLDANNITVDDNEVELMSKLKKYGENWVDEWAKKLRDDYQTQSDNVRR